MKKLLAAVAVAVAFASSAFAQTSVVQSSTNVNSGKNATYRAAAKSFTLAATPTNVCVLTGSATKTVYVKSVSVTGLKTTAGLSQVLLRKQTVADTGGTPVAGTAVAMDSTSSAATAAVAHYTANPTVGTGTVFYSNYMLFQAPAGTSDVNVHRIRFGEDADTGQYGVLRGVAQQIAVALDGATLTGGTFNCNWEWIEK